MYGMIRGYLPGNCQKLPPSLHILCLKKQTNCRQSCPRSRRPRPRDGPADHMNARQGLAHILAVDLSQVESTECWKATMFLLAGIKRENLAQSTHLTCLPDPMRSLFPFSFCPSFCQRKGGRRSPLDSHAPDGLHPITSSVESQAQGHKGDQKRLFSMLA